MASKILFVASEPAPGMVPFASVLINDFANIGECYAITVSGLGHDFSKYLSQKVSHISYKYGTSLFSKFCAKFFPIKLFLAIVNTARQNKVEDIYFLTGEYGLVFMWGHSLNKRYKVHYVVHDLESHPTALTSIKSKFFDSYFHRMTLRAIYVFDNLITYSKSQYQSLKKMHPEKNVVLRPFPSLVTEQMKNGTSVSPEINNVEGYVLFWGRVDLYKGVDLLYNAFLDSGLAKKTYLVVAGKGEDYFSRRSDEEHYIRINRYIDDEEIAQLFNRAKVVVFPYIQATMSGVLTVAHYFGTKVILSDVPYFKDNAMDSDVLFKTSDLKDLTECLKSEFQSN